MLPISGNETTTSNHAVATDGRDPLRTTTMHASVSLARISTTTIAEDQFVPSARVPEKKNSIGLKIDCASSGWDVTVERISGSKSRHDFDNRQSSFTPRQVDSNTLANPQFHQGFADRAGRRDLAVFGRASITEAADDLVGLDTSGLLVSNSNDRAEKNHVAGHLAFVDDLDALQARVELANAKIVHRLVLASRVVVRVFPQIPMATRFRDSFSERLVESAILAQELFQFLFIDLGDEFHGSRFYAIPPFAHPQPDSRATSLEVERRERSTFQGRAIRR